MKTYVIGEMAWGHSGSFDIALKLLSTIKDAKADAIGIHITNLETYMTKDYKCLDGQTLSAREETQEDSVNIYEYLEKINLTNEQWLLFDKAAKNLGVKIVAMCNDIESFEFSKRMNIDKYVIAASSFYEFDFIREIIKYNNDVIIRIGGANLTEIDNVVNCIFETDADSKINLLAGIQLYPTPMDQLHIKSIQTLAERYRDRNITLGLADHIDGDHPYSAYMPALALAYNVSTMEKHITTRRQDKLEDFEAALGSEEFKLYVDFIRQTEIVLGNGSLDYVINPQNEKYKLVLRKRIVASEFIKKGEVISKKNIAFKRSDYGTELQHLNELIGKKVKKDLNIDEGITFKNIEI
jgi:sialic acid synthase SpsE